MPCVFMADSSTWNGSILLQGSDKKSKQLPQISHPVCFPGLDFVFVVPKTFSHFRVAFFPFLINFSPLFKHCGGFFFSGINFIFCQNRDHSNWSLDDGKDDRFAQERLRNVLLFTPVFMNCSLNSDIASRCGMRRGNRVNSGHGRSFLG